MVAKRTDTKRPNDEARAPCRRARAAGSLAILFRRVHGRYAQYINTRRPISENVEARGVHTDLRALLCDIEREIAEHPVELAARGRNPAEVRLDFDPPAGAGLDPDGAEFSLQ